MVLYHRTLTQLIFGELNYGYGVYLYANAALSMV